MMYRVLSLLIVAIMATIVLAAPTPTKTISKRSFAAKAKGHGKLSGKEALQRAARKYGFTVNIPESDLEERHWDFEGHNHGFSQESDLPSSFPSSAVFAGSSSFPQPSASGLGGQPSASGFGGSSSSVVASGAPIPSSTSPAAPSISAPSSGGSETGTVSADPEQNDSMYLSPVTIGGNQKLNLDFDTGQAGNTGSHTAFDPSKSSTWKPYQGSKWQISYGDGSMAAGTAGFDAVTIGGVTAQRQCVELANQVSSTFLQDTNNDGLLGLAFSSINQVQPQQQKTFWENIMNDLAEPLFTANLEEDNSGTYEFGTIDSTKHQGSINYAPVDNSQGFWQIDFPSFSVGGAQQSCSNCNPAIVDTGTSLLIMDDNVVQAYYSQVQGAQNSATYGGFVYPCGTTLPDFGFKVGQYTAVIKGSDMTYAQATSQICYGGIQAGGTQAGLNILGDVMLKQFFAVFDGGNMQFGIAPKA